MSTPTIGISCDTHHSAICLQEPGPMGPVLATITDGFRPLIPVATGPEGSWGSAAVREGHPAVEPGDPLHRSFLEAMLARIHRHMGGSPTRPEPFGQTRRGPTMVVAAPAGAATKTCSELRQAFADLAAPIHSVIGASLATLAAGVHEIQALSQGDPGPRLVAAVCVGDQATEVSVCRLRIPACPPDGFQAVLAGPSVSLPAGARPWLERMAEMVIERTTAHGHPLDGARRLALYDAIFDYCERLQQQAPGVPLPWDGPLRNRAFTDLSFTRRDCTTLPGASVLQAGLGQALRDAAQTIPGENPSLVLVAGPGASFGVIQDICRDRGLTVVDLRQPQLAAARGASLWPEFQVDIKVETPFHRPEPMIPPAEPDLFALEAPDNPIPPWLRY